MSVRFFVRKMLIKYIISEELTISISYFWYLLTRLALRAYNRDLFALVEIGEGYSKLFKTKALILLLFYGFVQRSRWEEDSIFNF
ncbi:MAG: hypothetical protein CMC08_00515 [Flavobacteriaceae bacterium]|nr:hypothetical protein [Flavobacteriaceae bacterium]